MYNIIGEVNRRQITNVNLFPYCAIAYLEITFVDKATMKASGAFVGDRTIITAGHCVYDQKHGWAKSVKVTPGGSKSNYSTYISTTVKTVNGWVNSENQDYDYGIVKLSNSPGVGYFGIKAENDASLQNKYAYCYGYPTDKNAGTLWYDSGIIFELTKRQFLHSADTEDGNSGGPLVLFSDIDCIVGIHAGAELVSNYATRITNDVIDFVKRHT